MFSLYTHKGQDNSTLTELLCRRKDRQTIMSSDSIATADIAAESIATMLMNVEEGVSAMLSRLRRPRCCFVMLTFAAVIVFAGGRPISAALQGHTRRGDIIMAHTQTAGPIQGELPPPTVLSSPPQASPPPPPTSTAQQPICGNGKCEPPETIASCFADCPGVTTPAQCGEVRSLTHIITLLRPCSRLPTISCIPGTCTITARPNRFVLLSFLLCCLIGALPACPIPGAALGSRR